MSKKKFLIFGNTGFIGKNLEKFLFGKYGKNSVYGFGSKKINLIKKKDLPKLLKILNKKSIIFFLSFNKKQSNATIQDFETNYVMIKNFIKVLDKKQPKKIIFFSSQSIYGEDTDNPNTTEKTIPNPTSYYGIAKYIAERLLIKACFEKKIPLIVIRIPRVYGFGDSPKNYGPTKFVDFFKKGKRLEIWGNGDEKRDYLYINDLNKILEKLSNSNFVGTVNVCSGKSYSFMQIIRMIEKISKKKIEIKKKERTRQKVDHIMNNHFLMEIISKYKFTTLKENLSYLLSA